MSLDHTRPHLDVDVLLNIMQFSDKPTICRLMQISRPLYHHAPKLLIPAMVVLCRESHYESFTAFMAAEAPYRFKFLRNIFFAGHVAPSKHAAALLTDFLVRFGPDLELDRCLIQQAEAMFGTHPALAAAFGDLCGVKAVELGGMGPASAAVLRSSKMPLRSAGLVMDSRGTPSADGDDVENGEDEEGEHYEEDEEDEEGEHHEEADHSQGGTASGEDTDGEDSIALIGDEQSSSRNPIRLLRNCRHTLLSLTTSSCSTGPPTARYTTQYPLLTSLQLESNELPLTEHYVRAFPALQTLTLSTSQEELRKLSTDPGAFLRHREMNEAAQAQHGTWEELELVEGRLFDLFLLALLCPVKRLVLCGPLLDPVLLPPILHHAQPAYMRLERFDVPVFATGLFGQTMADLTAACIRSLDITLTVGIDLEPEQIDIVQTLDGLIDGLAGLSAKTVGLSISCSGLQLPHVDTPTVTLLDLHALFGSTPPSAAEEDLATLDLGALAHRVQAAAPSIRTAVVTLVGHRSRESTTVAVGAEAALALGADAVEAIPLRLAKRMVEASERGSKFLGAMAGLAESIKGQ